MSDVCKFCDKPANQKIVTGVAEKRWGIHPRTQNTYGQGVYTPKALVQLGICDDCAKSLKKKKLSYRLLPLGAIVGTEMLTRWKQRPVIDGCDVLLPVAGVDIALEPPFRDVNYYCEYHLVFEKDLKNPFPDAISAYNQEELASARALFHRWYVVYLARFAEDQDSPHGKD